MYENLSEFPPRRSMYTAKTMNLTASAVAAARDEETVEWGTMDPTPQRTTTPDPGMRLVDWGIAFGLLGLIGGATGIAATTMLAAGAVVAIKANPEMATASLASLRSAPTHQVAPIEVQPTPAPDAYQAAAPAPLETRRPTKRKRSRARTRTAAPVAPVAAPMPTSAPTVAAGDESAMSLSQLKSYLTDSPAPAAAPAAPAPPPVAAPAPSSYDADLEAILAEPVPSAGTQAAPVAPAPVARPQGTSRPVASSAAPAGLKMLSSRLGKMPNGVLILDEPFDPVPVAIVTDGDAAIYVDGELLGGAPMAVVVDRGSHDITVQSEKGTVGFNLDASEGEKWCFSVKREPKLGNCR